MLKNVVRKHRCKFTKRINGMYNKSVFGLSDTPNFYSLSTPVTQGLCVSVLFQISYLLWKKEPNCGDGMSCQPANSAHANQRNPYHVLRKKQPSSTVLCPRERLEG